MNKPIYAPNGFMYIFEPETNKEKPYKALMSRRYYSPRYKKSVVILEGDRSDGATCAIDYPSFSWWVHDNLCINGCWENGVKLTNWQCSMVLCDILWSEKRYRSALWWFFPTFIRGGGKCRDNGFFFLRG